jgi:leucyl-tRNA synthetase
MPIAPHFAEHVWSRILKQSSSIQLAFWPTPTQAIDRAFLEAATYMRGTTKTIRDAETALVKMLSKSHSKGKKDDRAMNELLAFNIRVNNVKPTLQSKTFAGITMIGTVPTFYKIPVIE